MSAKIKPYVQRVHRCEYDGKFTLYTTDRDFLSYNEIANFLRENPCLRNFRIIGISGPEGESDFPFIMIPSREPVENHSYVEFFHLKNNEKVCIHTLYEILYNGYQIDWE